MWRPGWTTLFGFFLATNNLYRWMVALAPPAVVVERSNQLLHQRTGIAVNRLVKRASTPTLQDEAEHGPPEKKEQ